MYFRHIEDTSAFPPGMSASTSAAEVSRRQFLKFTTIAGSGLTLGLMLPGCGTGPSSSGTAAGSSAPFRSRPVDKASVAPHSPFGAR